MYIFCWCMSQPLTREETKEHTASATGQGKPLSLLLSLSPHLSPTHAWFLNLWFRGETALHKAACQRNRAVCQLLVDAGASLRQTDSKVTGWVSANILPLWEIAGTTASTCARSTGILSVFMEGPGALEKGGKNRVLHLEKLQFKCRSTKGGCVLACGTL
jgi:hypothetical protein